MTAINDRGGEAIVATPPTRDDVRSILLDWRSHEWQIQGFGMLRTYLDGPHEPRLQVWDQRLACWGNNAIHDHPWSFTSTTYAGLLYNQRFDIETKRLCPACGGRGWRLDLDEPCPCFPPAPTNGHITEIIPGTRGGKLSEHPVTPCRITPQPVEVYSLGDRYSQTHREMHLTRYAQGTVTLIERFDREPDDIARVAWYGAAGEQPPFVNPYPATPEIAEVVIGDALQSWWLGDPLDSGSDGGAR